MPVTIVAPTKSFMFFRPNYGNVSQISKKVWCITRLGSRLFIDYGPAEFVKRRPVMKRVRHDEVKCSSNIKARKEMTKRIEAQLKQGYERIPLRQRMYFEKRFLIGIKKRLRRTA